MNEPRIAVIGSGAIGRAALRLLLDHRRGVHLVGAATKDPEAAGHSVAQVAGASTLSDVVFDGDLEAVLDRSPDVVLLCTGSFLRETEDQILACIREGAQVVSPCEELAWPARAHTREAGARIAEAAIQAGVTVLGTGVNPGFMFDSILAAATGAAWDVRSVWGRRVVDVSGFSQDIHRRLGIGYTLEEFEQGHQDGTIAGHVGFPESIGLVAERVGVNLDGDAEERFEPMIAETMAPTAYGGVEPGRTEGFVQIATGRVDGREWITLELLLHLRPEEAGYPPADTIRIDGVHPVNLEFRPGMDAILSTSAQLVNSIPTVLAAAPGLWTVTDLPDPAAFLGPDPRTIPGLMTERTWRSSGT